VCVLCVFGLFLYVWCVLLTRRCGVLPQYRQENQAAPHNCYQSTGEGGGGVRHVSLSHLDGLASQGVFVHGRGNIYVVGSGDLA
jgi:hypothetical protein